MSAEEREQRLPNYSALMVRALIEHDRAQHDGATFVVELSYPEAMYLLAVAQLGLRHPEIPQRTSDGATIAARKIVELFPEGSASRALAMLGFDPQHDQPTDAGREELRGLAKRLAEPSSFGDN